MANCIVSFRRACMIGSDRVGIVICQPTITWRTADAIQNDGYTSRSARGNSPTVRTVAPDAHGAVAYS